jgi:hypothetical protein
MKRKHHCLLFDSHEFAICHRGCRPHAQRLSCKAAFPEEIARIQDAYRWPRTAFLGGWDATNFVSVFSCRGFCLGYEFCVVGSRISREVWVSDFASAKDRPIRTVYEKCLWIAEKLPVFPRAFHLCDFLFERHPGKQVGDPLLDRQLWIAIWQAILRQEVRTEKS